MALTCPAIKWPLVTLPTDRPTDGPTAAPTPFECGTGGGQWVCLAETRITLLGTPPASPENFLRTIKASSTLLRIATWDPGH